jgi:hypothetical protein
MGEEIWRGGKERERLVTNEITRDGITERGKMLKITVCAFKKLMFLRSKVPAWRSSRSLNRVGQKRLGWNWAALNDDRGAYHLHPALVHWSHLPPKIFHANTLGNFNSGITHRVGAYHYPLWRHLLHTLRDACELRGLEICHPLSQFYSYNPATLFCSCLRFRKSEKNNSQPASSSET